MTNVKLNNYFSIDELKKYLEGELSAKECHEIEKAALNNYFLADAIEGFENFSAEINNIPNWKPKTPKTNFKWLIVSGGVAVVFISFFLFYYTNKKNTNKTVLTHSISIPFIKKASTPIDERANTQKEVREIVENINNPKIITRNNGVVIDSLQKQTTPKLEKYSSAKPFFDINEKKIETIKKRQIKTISYYQYIAVDYSLLYKEEKTR